jgi:indolepyruvate ferredoxin oxidoreductase
MAADKSSIFAREEGVIQLGGIDALVRLALDQVRTDRRRGLNTALFVSGYRGSPVGMLDQALIRQQKLLAEHNIKFVDGLNEDLAATAVWGTQMLHTVGRPKFDGVTGMWYGKAPGVDRSGDALKHGNYTGIGGLAVQLAQLPDEIRGYGHVKERSSHAAKAREAKLLEAFRAPGAERAAA